MYQHVKVPAGGRKITVNKDSSLNVPDNPIIPYIEGDGTGLDITPVMIKVVDAAVAKAYGGKRKIHWMEIYAGEKSTKVYGPDVWLPDGDARDPQGLRRVDQGPADDARRRRHPLAQRRAAAGARPLRLPAPGALVHGRAQPGQGAAEDRHGDLPRELRGHLRRHRMGGRVAEARRSSSSSCINEMGVKKIRFPATSGIGIKPVSREGTERLVRKAIQYAIDNDRRR